MRILLITPEIAPILKIGGIADGVAALAKTLRRFGHEVTIAVPRHRPLEPRELALDPLPPIELHGDDRVALYRDHDDPDLCLFEVPGDHDDLGLYGHDIDDSPANARRFGLFTRAVIELCRRRREAGAPFDVVHAHEWPAAMVPYLIRERRGELGPIATVLTLHNLAFQGIFGPDALAHLGLGAEHFRMDRLEFYGRINFLKGGIVSADALTTVSPGYAREIQSPGQGELLDGVLRARGGLLGIVNGIDTERWNPAADAALPARYDAADPSAKAICKRAIRAELGLGTSDERPLVASIGRVVEQKGSDHLAAALPAIVAAGADVIIAGAGSPAMVRLVRAAAAASPDHARYLGYVGEDAARRLLAAADLVVMPSRYEPCGIVQMQAQRYGAAPVAPRTGGFVDTIVDDGDPLAAGTGFLYAEPSAEGLAGAVRRALAAMADPRWGDLRRRMMRLDLGWTRPARRYEEIYRRALLRKAGA